MSFEYLDQLHSDLHQLTQARINVHVSGPPGVGKSTTVHSVLAAIEAEVVLCVGAPEVEGPELVQSFKLENGSTTLHCGPLWRAALRAQERLVAVRVTECQYMSRSALQYIAMLTDAERRLRLPLGGVVTWPENNLVVVMESNPPWSPPDFILDRFVYLHPGSPTPGEIRAYLEEKELPEAGSLAVWWSREAASGRAPSLRRFDRYVTLRTRANLAPESAAKLTFGERCDSSLLTALAAFFPLPTAPVSK